MFQTRRGLSVLRIVPLISWSLSAFAISLGFAVHKRHSASAVDWAMAAIVLVSAVLIQAAIVRRQYRSAQTAAVTENGTNANSNVNTKRQKKALSEQRIFWLGILGSLLAVALGVYIARTTQSWVWLCSLVAVWVGLAYTCHPVRYVPLLMEWLVAFPAMVIGTLGTYFILSDGFDPVVGWAAVLHSLLMVAWLMQVQLGDVARGRGRKDQRLRLTTVAWVSQKFGAAATRHVPAAYFLLTAFVGLLATLEVTHVFLMTVFCSLLGAISSWNTNPRSKRKVTEAQLKMIVINVIHAVFVSVWVAWM